MLSILLTNITSSEMPPWMLLVRRRNEGSIWIAAQELVQMNAPISRSNQAAKKEASCGMSRQQAIALMMLGREVVKLMKMLFVAVVVLGAAAVGLMLKK